jgi:hypothetical protein
MGDRLKGKVAVVTGAGRGIGKAEALALAGEGTKVIVNDLGISIDGTMPTVLPADEVVATINQNGGEALANYDSVATSEGAERIIKAAIDNFGKIDILVNNAGVLKAHMIFNLSDEEWDEIIKVHLYGHFYCTRAACRWFRQQKSGRIINTSSPAGLGVPGAVHYASAKEGIIGLTRSVSIEMRKYNVTCNAIRPLAVTRLAQVIQPKPDDRQETAANKEAFLTNGERIMGGSLPEDIAPVVVYLASDEAAHITGRTFFVRRGEVSLYSEPSPLQTLCKSGTWTVAELADAFTAMWVPK